MWLSGIWDVRILRARGRGQPCERLRGRQGDCPFALPETPSAPPLEPAASIPGAVSLETVVAAQSDKTDPDGSQPSQAAPWLAEWLAGVGIHGQLSVAAAAALESLGVEKQADISLLGESDLVEAGVALVSARRIMKAI